MHYAAEYGIAAHYFYKKTSGNGVKSSPKMSHWMQKVLELQKEFKSNKDFLKNLKVDIFRDRIFVFTPKGDVFDLPEGAIGVDFAYHIHSDLGNHATKLYRNGKPYPILSMLKNGETLEVISSEEQLFPPREWIEKAKTNLAKRKIKEALKKQSDEQSYSEGILFLKKTFKRYGLPALNHLQKEQKEHLIHSFHSSHWHDFLVSVGNGTISQHEFIGALYTPEQILGKPYYHKEVNYSPLPRLNYQIDRGMISPSSIPTAPYYRITLIVKTVNRVGLLRDLGSQLSELGVNIHRIGVRTQKGNRKEVLLDTVIEVIDLLQLENACDGIEAIEGILDVSRWVAPKKKSVPSST
jgi:(p)ppGpp synthase/HD superfamily hydrolase